MYSLSDDSQGAGFPHSEIYGSKFVHNSPQLIAVYYVFHRLLAPRHPLYACKTLDRSHRQCPPSVLDKKGALMKYDLFTSR
ncbi:uncharacterized protein METZ01_LOCUS168988 [marine metagenome]|uniref:Uncharacterized protein n=1 Tax=marine metagenome TaxID=408172 RepID=A0A382BR44_9ZZZZ